VLLRQVSDNGVSQGCAVDLRLKFLSGVCRGRFSTDGNVCVCGLNGWRTSARADGCLQRVRYTGKPLDVPLMQMQVGYNLLTTENRKDVGSVFLTIHTTGK